jgi:hypothetical protein
MAARRKAAAATPADALAHVRASCLGLPEVEERLSHGAPTFFVRGKKSFVMFHDDHHGDGRLAIWCAAPPGAQVEAVHEEPERFFVPPYVGGRGWLGVRLDRTPDWVELDGIVRDAYRQVAPKSLVATMDADERDA